MAINKRQSQRDGIEEMIELEIAGTDKRIMVLLLDLSPDGLGFQCNEEIEPGTLLIGNIETWDRDKIPVVVKVVRTFEKNGGFGHGCTFVGMEKQHRTRIEIYQKFRETGQM